MNDNFAKSLLEGVEPNTRESRIMRLHEAIDMAGKDSPIIMGAWEPDGVRLVIIDAGAKDIALMAMGLLEELPQELKIAIAMKALGGLSV